MRWTEVASGYRMPVSGEEQSIIDRAVSDEGVAQKDLDERDQEVARKMVSRGLLDQRKGTKGVHYRARTAKDIWRPR